MKKLYLFLIFVLVSVIGIPSALAYGNQGHLNLTDSAITESTSTLAGFLKEHRPACLSGIEYPDVGIFYYYTDFKAYAGLHNYGTVEQMLRIATTDDQRAFAYCYKLHLAQDAISHNYVIPAAIKKTGIPNYIIHPVKELKIEGYFLNPIGYKLMENHAKYDAFVQEATNKDWSVDAENLNRIMGGVAGNLYSEAFTFDKTSFIGKFEGIIYTGLKYFVSNEQSVPYQKLSILESKKVLEGQTPSLDPAGAKALEAADAESELWTYLITLIVTVIVFGVSWKMGWIGW